jgi:Mn2+/Fe2+ NRAMP family transporter
MGELPAPVPFNAKNLMALLGPGLVMVGGSIGTGEWVQGAGVAALYRGALLWVAPIAILCQVLLNTEVMRYTLVTGEPMFTGFMRSRPGPRFWLLWYLLLDVISWWPALAGLAAQILIYTIFQADPQPQQVQVGATCILLLCGTLLCFGGRIYNTLEVVLGGKVFFVLGYLIIVDLFFCPPSVWGQVFGGMVNPFWIPENVDWTLVGGVVGFAGIGGMGNILASNYVREKGWGMGAHVGAIPSAIGGSKIALSHLGTMARPTEEAQRRFNRWWGYIKIDQFGLWLWGSIIGMALPCILGATYLKSNYFQHKGGHQWKAAAAIAQDFGAEHGAVLGWLTLLCGFIIMFPGQFSAMDGIARRWCDALWSGSRRVRAMDPSKIRVLYYGFVAAYVTVGVLLTLRGISAPKMMVISGNMANLALASCIVQTLYVNSTFLPPAFRPSVGKRALLALAACFYVGIFCFVGKPLLEKLMNGTLFN